MPDTETTPEKDVGLLDVLLRALITGKQIGLGKITTTNEEIEQEAFEKKNQLFDYLSRQGLLVKSIGTNNPLSGNGPRVSPEMEALGQRIRSEVAPQSRVPLGAPMLTPEGFGTPFMEDLQKRAAIVQLLQQMGLSRR